MVSLLTLTAGAFTACSSSQNRQYNSASSTPASTIGAASSAGQNIAGYGTGYVGGYTSYDGKMNTPSAPLETPICGAVLHERAQSDAKIYARSLESGNSCTLNACFQPLTGTYISDNGSNVVCR